MSDDMEKKILIYRLSALGDVAMTVPAIYSLAEQYPKWKIRVVTEERFVALFVNHPSNISFISVRKRDIQGVMGIMRFISLLQREDTYAFVDFHNVLRSWILDLAFIFAGKKVVVLDKRRLGRLFHKGTMVQPFVYRYFDTLRKVCFSLYPSFTSLKFASKMEKGKDVWVGIAPFARYENKTYPIDKMKGVVNMLSKQDLNIRIFIFGFGNYEHQVIDGWVKDNPRIVNLSNRFNLAKELELMSRLDVMVSMDSANMHLASLVGIPVISVWGATAPSCGFLGWKQKMEDTICLKKRCQPCSVAGGHHCKRGDLACLNDIEPNDIVQKVMMHLYGI